MEDIVPQLVQAITDEFHRLYDSSSKIKTLLAKVKGGSATYAEAQEYALEVSRLIGKAYEKHISSAALPDGKMYYNIASRLIPEALDKNYSLVSSYAASVQTGLNKNAGIGLKAQTATVEQDRIDGLVDLASNAEQYDDVAGQLLTAFENFSQHVVDTTIQKNADFQYKAGLTPKIIRKAERKCCQWCRDLAGEYDYPDVPEDVYRRHENCRCTVLYDPADGRKSLQDVHTKRWTEPKDYAKITSKKENDEPKVVSGAFRSGKVKDAINKDLQAPHCIDSGKYTPGKSYLYGDVSDAEELYDQLKGTGEPIYDKNGNWKNKERVTIDSAIGVWISGDGSQQEETCAAMIVYSKTGSHIYPRKEG